MVQIKLFQDWFWLNQAGSYQDESQGNKVEDKVDGVVVRVEAGLKSILRNRFRQNTPLKPSLFKFKLVITTLNGFLMHYIKRNIIVHNIMINLYVHVVFW
jgi:hypothetical protein